jgi:plasmid stabilization system protein ParE
MKVITRPKAEKSIASIGAYISEKGYPDTAEEYLDRMKRFAQSLAISPDKYPICRFAKFAKENFHCATFEQNYIFVYKIIHKQIVIYNVIHGKAMK